MIETCAGDTIGLRVWILIIISLTNCGAGWVDIVEVIEFDDLEACIQKFQGLTMRGWK